MYQFTLLCHQFTSTRSTIVRDTFLLFSLFSSLSKTLTVRTILQKMYIVCYPVYTHYLCLVILPYRLWNSNALLSLIVISRFYISITFNVLEFWTRKKSGWWKLRFLLLSFFLILIFHLRNCNKPIERNLFTRTSWHKYVYIRGQHLTGAIWNANSECRLQVGSTCY